MSRPRSAIIYAVAMAMLLAARPAHAQALAHPEDRRLLQIAERVQLGNAALCDRQAPALGVALSRSLRGRGAVPAGRRSPREPRPAGTSSRWSPRRRTSRARSGTCST